MGTIVYRPDAGTECRFNYNLEWMREIAETAVNSFSFLLNTEKHRGQQYTLTQFAYIIRHYYTDQAWLDDIDDDVLNGNWGTPQVRDMFRILKIVDML